ncbi:hypothetical protein NL676_010885 [Syzygium grande]|nr:hypothetical protein NL676_010885 [Syzygium grande]
MLALMLELIDWFAEDEEAAGLELPPAFVRVIVGKWYLHYEKDCLKSSNKTSKQILLFNCMDVRDPQILLPDL